MTWISILMVVAALYGYCLTGFVIARRTSWPVGWKVFAVAAIGTLLNTVLVTLVIMALWPPASGILMATLIAAVAILTWLAFRNKDGMKKEAISSGDVGDRELHARSGAGVR
ncbi:MAG: hypothetical protein ACYC2T_04310 [Bacillota bacterium]